MFRCQDKGIKGKRSTTFRTGVKFSKWSDLIENGLKLIGLLCWFQKGIVCHMYNVLISRSMEGSKVNTHRHHIGNDLWPLDYPSSWHCRCMNLYIFWMHTLVWLIWAQFHQNRMILIIWPLCKRSLTFILFSHLSWQRNIVWISCNWLFFSSWLEEEFEIYFNLIGVFLSFIPIYPLTLDFMVNMVFEKNARHVYLKVWTFLSVLIYEFPNTYKMGTGLQKSLH